MTAFPPLSLNVSLYKFFVTLKAKVIPPFQIVRIVL